VQAVVVVKRAQMRAMLQELESVPKAIPRALSGAINDTSKKEVTEISKLIRARTTIKKRDIDKHLRRDFSSPKKLEGGLSLEKSGRIALGHFGARQTKGGVTYKISKTGGRNLVPDAFGPDIPRLGLMVYKRAGKDRTPLIKLYGPSPWGIVVKNDLQSVIGSDAQEVLTKSVARRVNLEVLRLRGEVK